MRNQAGMKVRAVEALRRGSGRAFRVALTLTLLSSSSPVAPRVLADAASEWRVGAALWLQTGPVAELQNYLLAAQNAPRPKRQEKQADRDARVRRVEISPGDVTLQLNERVVFIASALDAEGRPVGGVTFDWSATDEGRGRAARVSQRGEFAAVAPGAYKVTADAGGKKARVTVNVLDGPRRNPNEKPIPADGISSRERPSAVSVPAKPARRPARRGSSPKFVKTSLARPEPAAPAPRRLPDCSDEYVWNGCNYPDGDDPGNRRGNPPGGPIDQGAGNGNFQIASPVLSLPGRGLSVQLGLAYNSRVWTKSDTKINYDIDQDWPAPGWSLGFGRVVGLGKEKGGMIVEADGTRHSFAGPPPQVFSWGANATLHTIDGSFIDYSTFANAAGTIIHAHVRYPNGTQITYGAPGAGAVYPISIVDVNGNFINVTYRNNAGPRIQNVTDTLGRTVNFHYDVNNLLTAVVGPGLDGDTRTLVRLHYTELPTLDTSFVGLTPMVRDYTPPALDAIYYPSTGTGYWFGDSNSYNSYGIIQKVLEQRGMGFAASSLNEQGTVTQGVMSQQRTYGFQLTNLTDAPTFTSLTESHEGMDTPAAVTLFESFPNSTPRTVTVTLPNNTQSIQYSFNHPGSYDDGLIYRDETKAGGVVVRSSDVVWQQGHYDSPRPVSVTSTNERGQRTGVEMDYGPAHNRVVESRAYDYGYTYLGTSNVLLRKTVTQYHTGAGYANTHVFNLPTVVENYDGAGVRVTRVEYQYDGATPPATPNGATSLANLPTEAAQHSYTHNPFAPEYMVEECALWDNDQINCLQWNQRWTSDYLASTDYRGNITQVTTYADAAANPAAGAVTETRAYDITGNMVSSSSSCCEVTTYNYTADTQYNYPSSITRGSSQQGSPLRVTTGSTYDFGTGLTLSTYDADGRTSQTNYEAGTLRDHEAVAPSGARTVYAYDDTQLKVTQTVLLSNGGAVAAKSVSFLNGLGQIKRLETLAAPEAATWEASALNVVETKYDELGRIWQISRPYRKGSETPRWMTNNFDAQGRLWKVEDEDGAVTTSYFNDLDPARPRPSVASSAPGETTLVVDAWGRERWGRNDALGQLVEVVEPDPDGSGSVATGGLVTTYAYNLLGGLTNVAQGVQQRRFDYDSLGRLVRQKPAEMDAVFNDAGQYVGPGHPNAVWSELFAYDTRSNLVTRIDARNVKTSFSYEISPNTHDPLNRLRSVSYTVQTGSIPAADSVEYTYETAGNLNRVTAITTKNPADGQTRTTESYHFDAQKRADQKTVTLASRPGFALVTNYAFDNLDRVTDITYPEQAPSNTRKTVHHDYDVAGRLSGLTVGAAAYASEVDYNAAGQTKTLKVGAAGANQVTEVYDYDAVSGLLMGQRAYRGTNPSQNRLMHLTYGYLRAGTTQGRTGQLTRATDNINPEKGRVFVYDAVGRLKHVGGGDTAQAELWTQDYTYDRFGNRTHVTATGSTASLKAPADPSVKTPDVELAAHTPPQAPDALRERSRGAVTDAPGAPLLSSAAAKSLAPARFTPGAPTNVTVTSSSATQVSLSWSPPAGGADHYEVERSQSLSGQFTFVGTAAGAATTFNDTTVAGGSAYLYRVRAADALNSRSAPSNVALGAAFTFADNPLVANTTAIKAQHINELRQAVNAVRAVAGLAAATWTDPTLTASLTTVRAVHIQELRDNLNQALTTLQINTSPFTDPVLTTGAGGVTAKRAHVEELRQRASRGQSASTGGAPGGPVPRDGFDTLTYDAATNRINSSGWEYDAAGNQTRVRVGPNAWQRYEYDAVNRLVAVKTDGGAVITSYTYGVSNARLVSHEGSSRTYYAWGTGAVVAEYTEADGTSSANSPQWSKSYVYFAGRLLATQQPVTVGERVEYHHPDRLGTRVVSNNADQSFYEQTTMPFGTALPAETTGETNRRFTSYDRSQTTGLDYASNRFYDSQQGRFTQVDPMGLAAGSLEAPQTLNLYTYCGNDPVNRTDSTGLLFGWLKRLFNRVVRALIRAVVVAVYTFLMTGNFNAAIGAFAATFWKELALPTSFGRVGATPGTFPTGSGISSIRQAIQASPIGRLIFGDPSYARTPTFNGFLATQRGESGPDRLLPPTYYPQLLEITKEEVRELLKKNPKCAQLLDRLDIDDIFANRISVHFRMHNGMMFEEGILATVVNDIDGDGNTLATGTIIFNWMRNSNIFEGTINGRGLGLRRSSRLSQAQLRQLVLIHELVHLNDLEHKFDDSHFVDMPNIRLNRLIARRCFGQ